MRMAQSQDDIVSKRKTEVGTLQEDRSKAVIANVIAEATKAVEEANAEVQIYRGGSDGTLSSRRNSPIEPFEK